MKGLNFNQLALAVALAGYGVTAVAAVEDAGHIDLGPVEMTPMATLGIGYDDNVYRDSTTEGLADKSSTVYKLDAEAEFKAQTGLSTYAAKLAARNTSYSSQSDANFTDVGVTGDIHQEINSRNRLDVDFDFGRYHDAGSTVNLATDKSAPEYDKTQGGLRYGFGSMEAMARADLFGSYDKEKYKSGGLDRKTTEYGATAYYRFMPKTDALVEIKKRDLEYTQVQDGGYDITSYLVGLNWEATAKSTGYAKLGRRYRDSQVAGVDTQGYTGWEVGVSYLPVDHSLIQLSTTRDYGLESDNPAAADFTQGSTTQLIWQHDWTAKLTTRANYAYTDEEVQNRTGITQKDRTVNQLGLAVDWNVMRNAKVSLSYGHTKRDESRKQASADEDSYSRNYYMLTGTIAL